MAARMFSEEQPEQLRSFSDLGRDDLIRYFTLTQADMAFVDPGRGQGPADRLGLAVQLCTLPWLGSCRRPDRPRADASPWLLASNELGPSKDVGAHPPGDSITSPVPYNAEAMVLVAITSTACGPSMLCGEM